MLVGVARVGLVGTGVTGLAAVGVVGEGDVDLAGLRRRLDVLGPVHLRRADLVTGEPREHAHLFGGHPLDVRDGAVLGGGDQRDPGAAAVELAVARQLARAVDLDLRGVAGELGDVERALVEQRQVVLARPAGVPVPHPLAADELVEVVEALVVAGVDDRAPVLGQPHGRGLVLEAAEQRVLARGGVGVVRVQLDDVPEAVRLVRLLGDVEPLVETLPLALGGAGAEAVALVGGPAAVGEVLVEVLLAVERGAPRGGAAGAVVEGAEDLAAGAVGGGLDQVGAGGRAGQPELGGRGDPPVEPVPRDGLQPAAPALLLHDHGGQAVRRPGDLDLLAGRVLGVVVAEHEHLVGVLVVGDEDLAAVLTAQRQQREEVVVVAELPGLRLRALLLRVEGGRAAQDRLAPADHHVLPVPLRDGHDVVGVGRDGREPEPARTVRPRRFPVPVSLPGRRRGLRRRRPRHAHGPGARGGHGDDGGGTHHGTAAERAGDDVTDVLVGAGVGHLVEAGVTTPETAGHGGPAAGVRTGRRSDQRQQLAHCVLPLRIPGCPGVSVTVGAHTCGRRAPR